jgi:UDP:flavonoid glycosyltransferase YjiC (YdhE family)
MGGALIVAHVGETLGHLVRALAIADALHAEGMEVQIAASEDAAVLLESWNRRYKHHAIPWGFSHNDLSTDGPSASFENEVVKSVRELKGVISKIMPDVVVGFPGLFSAQVARGCGVEHVSIMHAPYLSPRIKISRPSRIERSALGLTNELLRDGGPIDVAFAAISSQLGLPRLQYRGFLKNETIMVPQPGLCIEKADNLSFHSFISATYGEEYRGDVSQLGDACYVSFGSGNPCDLTLLLEVAAEVFPRVIFSAGRVCAGSVPSGVEYYDTLSSHCLAGRIGAVISHGGIGTVGTFARYGCPQLIIPTEPDQATMAVHGPRLGVAIEYGLEAWAENPKTGRRLPALQRAELRKKLEFLRDQKSTGLFPADTGAFEIAQEIVAKCAGHQRAGADERAVESVAA